MRTHCGAHHARKMQVERVPAELAGFAGFTQVQSPAASAGRDQRPEVPAVARPSEDERHARPGMNARECDGALAVQLGRGPVTENRTRHFGFVESSGPLRSHRCYSRRMQTR
jgi:hypothetical protein